MGNWFKRAEDGERRFKHLIRHDKYIGFDRTYAWEYMAPVVVLAHKLENHITNTSNWEVQLQRIPESGTVEIREDMNWEVGWIKWLAIDKSDSAALAEAEKIGEELEKNPILDADHRGKLEWSQMTKRGFLWDREAARWTIALKGYWTGELNNIKITDLENTIASGTFEVEYIVHHDQVEVKKARPINVRVKRARGSAVVASDGHVVNPGLAQLIAQELIHNRFLDRLRVGAVYEPFKGLLLDINKEYNDERPPKGAPGFTEK